MPTPIALRPDKDDDRRTLPARHQLYQRLLGASFERLPDTLRRFHAGPGGTAEFAMEVTYEPGFLRTVLSALLRLPKPSPRAPGKLVVTVRDDREVWERIFPDTKLRTVHWIDGDHLVEEAGPLQFVFDVDANERGLRFSSIACRFLGFAAAALARAAHRSRGARPTSAAGISSSRSRCRYSDVSRPTAVR